MTGRDRCASACVVLLSAALALSACGSSSPSSKSSTAASAGDRRAQIDACLKKQGINPPQRPPGGGGTPGGGLFGGGGGGGQSSANGSKVQAALRKCGITFRGGPGVPGRGGFLSRPGARQALTKFVTCVRKNGYALPAPNTSGNGPVFDRSKVNTSDPKFQAAARKCQSLLPSRPAGPPPGAAGSGTGTGA